MLGFHPVGMWIASCSSRTVDGVARQHRCHEDAFTVDEPPAASVPEGGAPGDSPVVESL